MVSEFLEYGYIFGSTRYWFWTGLIYLLILTWQDHRHAKMRVDQRLNFFVLGTTFSLLSHIRRPLWYILVSFAIILLLTYVINKYKLLGNGDAGAILWIFWGCVIQGAGVLVSFACIFVVITAAYHVIKLGVFRYKGATPFFGVILMSFVLNGLLMGLY